MKSFRQFIYEAISAAEKAKKLNLRTDGHGGWLDPRTGEFVAKTVGNELVFYNKRQIIGAKDPNQTEHEKSIPSPSYNDHNVPLPGTFSWDGCDINGSVVPTGVYLVKFSFTNFSASVVHSNLSYFLE